METQKRNKIPAVYLNDETHAAMKKWADYQGSTLPKLAQAVLEEMQPVFEQMIVVYEDMLAGVDEETAKNKLIARSLAIAVERLNKGENDGSE